MAVVAVAAAAATGSARGAFPGRPGLLVFQRDGDPNTQIWTMTADGRDARRLTSGYAAAIGPVWSPNGRRIAFERTGADVGGDTEVVTVDARGKARKIVVAGTKVEGGTGVAWSPDGRRLVFLGVRKVPDAGLNVVGSDGRGLRALTTLGNRQVDYGPAWSPDGKRILFTRGNYAPLTQPGLRIKETLYVIDANGRNLRRLVTLRDLSAIGQTGVDFDYEAAWSPDGKRIAYTRADANGAAEIWTMNADGSDKRNLSRDPADDRWPAWSPDGTKIVFSSRRDGNGELYVMDAVTGAPQTRVTSTPTDETRPDWQPLPKG